MSVLAHEILEAARAQAGMSLDDLWLAYFALGGSATASTVGSYLAGDGKGCMEYDLLALALNERFSDLDRNHPVPYRDELPGTSPGASGLLGLSE